MANVGSCAYIVTVMFSQFMSFLLFTGGGASKQMHYLANVPGIEHFLAKKCSCLEGESGHMHYLANVPGIEHFLAKKCSCQEGGGSIPECHAGCLYKHHALLLNYYQSDHLLLKGILKACTCLYSEAARHSGILTPSPLGISTNWLMFKGLSTFWLRIPPPQPWA